MAKKEEETERIGDGLVPASLSRKRKIPVEYSSGEDGSVGSSRSGVGDRKKRKKGRRGGMAEELAPFSVSLKDSDIARNLRKRDQMALER